MRLTVTSDIFTLFFQIRELRLISSPDEEAIIRLLSESELTPVLVCSVRSHTQLDLPCRYPNHKDHAWPFLVPIIFTRAKFGDDFKLPHARVDMARNKFRAQERVGCRPDTGGSIVYSSAGTRDVLS